MKNKQNKHKWLKVRWTVKSFISYNNIMYTYLIKYFHFHIQTETFNAIEYLISIKNREKNVVSSP